MIGYVSGETRRAVLLQGGQYAGCELDSDGVTSLVKHQLSAFFMHSRDVEQVECGGREDLILKLRTHWLRDRALRLTLIALDPTMVALAREECASLAESLLTTEETRLFVVYRLYANALPAEFPVREVSDFLGALDVPVLEEIFDLLVIRQTSVISCVSAWNDLPDSVFGDSDRCEVKARVIKTGAFYDFATSENGNNKTLFKLLADPVMKGRSGTREIVNLWASKYKEKPKSHIFEYYVEVADDDRHNGPIDGAAAYNMYQQVKKQTAQIKSELSANNSDKVEKLVVELVRFQRRGPSEYLSKSLCDLASYAKGLGDIDRAIELTRMAIDETPSDAWAHVQLGNLLLEKGDWNGALKEFDDGEIFGDPRAAQIGRAEALKSLGQMDVALEVINSCIEAFPVDEVARNARAAVLAHFGHLESALDAYNQIIEFSLSSSIAMSGRANILHDLGHSDAAVRDMDIAISLATDDLVPRVGKADMLREQNRFSEALKAVEGEHRTPKWRLQFGAARARILRDLGDWNECKNLLSDLISDFPRDINLHIAKAELERRMGRFDLAFATLSAIELNFNQARAPKIAMAVVLAALGKTEEALAYLPERDAATRADWVGLHIRGMIEVRRGNFDLAKQLFQRGLDFCPWVQQKPYFSSGLAFVRLRQGQYEDALRVVDEAETKFAPITKGAIAVLREHARIGTRAFSAAMLGLSEDEGILGALIARRLTLAPPAEMDEALYDVEWHYLMTLAA
jgi:tetratricopeptide (TPR) repeat protein